MAIDFAAPSLRAAGQDLTISISPLGLVELADEEFEVHGPRLNRYANYWAFYLGHHWAYRRAPGEPMVTFNYVKALSDFLVNFTFHQGVDFQTEHEFQHIIPALLDRIWSKDNQKAQLLWEIGNLGSVQGDSFIKVSYDPSWEDPTGRVHPGRVKIMPINGSFCFPEWHPHDRERLLRFKLKYRFWGCYTPDMEALTRRGWKHYWEITDSDELLVLDPVTDRSTWAKPSAVNVYDYNGDMLRWHGRVPAFSTPNHRWLAEVQRGRGDTLRYDRKIVHGEFVKELREGSRLVVGGGTPLGFSQVQKWSDEMVQTVAWYITEGWDHYNQQGIHSINISQKKPEGVAHIRNLMDYWNDCGATFNERRPDKNGVITWYLGNGVRNALEEAAPGKQITPEFLCELTRAQAYMFRDFLLMGDGCRTHGTKKTIRWTQLDVKRQDGYQMLCAMLGIRTVKTSDDEKIQEYTSRYAQTRHLNETTEHYEGKVWCPTVPTGVFMARQNGATFWTGNTAPEGTRQVYTYVEIITDEWIEEYVNDQLIDRRPNPLGVIPIVHIANQIASASPWGLSDVADLTSLNREFNEKATNISDIINYHVSPVTILTGARASNLERGPNKLWAIPNEKAKVENLSGGTDALPSAMEYLELIKRGMHEMTGVPENALGQDQEISNTSGVALAIQYLPLTMRYEVKKIQYGVGIKKINRLALLTLFLFEPETAVYNPDTDGILEDPEVQPEAIDPLDPDVYETQVIFPPPMPVDGLVKLNEIQAKMALGLESRKGALRDMGEQFPDEKLQELQEEQIIDAKMAAAIQLIQAHIAAVTTALTGMVPGEGGPQPQQTSPTKEGETPPPNPPAVDESSALPKLPGIPDVTKLLGTDGANLMADIITQAYGTKIPQRRIVPGPDDNN